MAFAFKTLTDYLNGCSYDEFDRSTILDDVIKSLDHHIDTLTKWEEMGYAAKRPETADQEIEDCFEILDWIEMNLEDARQEALEWYDSQREEDKGHSSWINEEPRAFGYAAYIDATGGDFSSSNNGDCAYCGGNGWTCC
jgi:Ran GTPase-activating protein (RanGAP) involved in mRNA processing and transport